MLLLLTGSSASGKTAIAERVRMPRLVVHDFDEDGVPETPDAAWRQATLAHWVDVALAHQADGDDTLLSGATPLGELLAVPAATELDGIAAALVDVADDEREARLDDRPDDLGDIRDDLVGWARWHRAHAADPTHEQHVITSDGLPSMRFDRWTGWAAGDPRWRVRVIDTTDRQPDEVARDAEAWIREQRRLLADGHLPLARGWEASRTHES